MLLLHGPVVGEALFGEACGQRGDQILEGAPGRIAELTGGRRRLEDDGSHGAPAPQLRTRLPGAIQPLEEELSAPWGDEIDDMRSVLWHNRKRSRSAAARLRPCPSISPTDLSPADTPRSGQDLRNRLAHKRTLSEFASDRSINVNGHQLGASAAMIVLGTNDLAGLLISRAVAIQFVGGRLRHGWHRGRLSRSDWSDFRALPPARR